MSNRKTDKKMPKSHRNVITQDKGCSIALD